MNDKNTFWFRLEQYNSPTPVEKDFDPVGGCLDAQSAWRNFGGLNLIDAYEKFTSAPEVYQEDFMFMGSKAFEYYFPVIDRYLREIESEDDWDDCSAAILGSVITMQFEWDTCEFSTRIITDIESLTTFVRANLIRYTPAEEEVQRIDREWLEAERALEKYRSSRKLT